MEEVGRKTLATDGKNPWSYSSSAGGARTTLGQYRSRYNNWSFGWSGDTTGSSRSSRSRSTRPSWSRTGPTSGRSTYGSIRDETPGGRQILVRNPYLLLHLNSFS